MFVGKYQLELLMIESQSLKGKRQVIKSLTQRLKNRFNVSIAEVGLYETYRQGELGIAVVSNEKKHLEKVFQNIIAFIEQDGRLEVVNIFQEYV